MIKYYSIDVLVFVSPDNCDLVILSATGDLFIVKDFRLSTLTYGKLSIFHEVFSMI